MGGSDTQCTGYRQRDMQTEKAEEGGGGGARRNNTRHVYQINTHLRCPDPRGQTGRHGS